MDYFTEYQTEWIFDFSGLKIIEKSRQIGITYADAYNSVLLVTAPRALLDVWISSRDETQAKLYLEDCKFWADFLHQAATDLGVVILDQRQNISARVLEFANGRRIYCVSSNPNALAGKRGHVKLDEFALHEDQRLLYRVAKPVTQWGGSLSIISTHRGEGTLFNQIIQRIRAGQGVMSTKSKVQSLGSKVARGSGEWGNLERLQSGSSDLSFAGAWSLHTVPIQKAVEQGLVERINAKAGRRETRAGFLARLQAECIDPEQWDQEYCCIPFSESSAFISYEMIAACEDPSLRLMDYRQLAKWLGLQES